MAAVNLYPNDAFAMGQAPSTCNNRYDAAITHVTISNGTATFDPIADQNLAFEADRVDGYVVSMTIRTMPQSTQGNQNQGTAWYHDTVYGYANGHCVDDVGPDSDTVITRSANFPPSQGPARDTAVEWWAMGGPTVSYTVQWRGTWDNSPAQPSDDYAETVENTPVTIPVLANDADPDGDALSIYSVSSPQNGSAVQNSDDTITYAPNPGFVGADLFSYYASDGKQGGAWADVAITVRDAPQTTATISIKSSEMAGYEFEGIWVELWQNGTLVSEGPTPFSARVDTGAQYEVFADDWQDLTFDHWSDGTTGPRKEVAITGDYSLTAFFQTGTETAGAPVSLDVESADMSGEAFSGQWVELWEDGVIVKEGFTPFLASVASGGQYRVFVYDDPLENKFFDRWDDGTTDQTMPVSISQDTTITALFQTPGD